MVADIVIGTHNRLGMLKRTVERIEVCTSTPYHLTVIDDGSNDGTAEWVESKGITLYRHEEQMGMHGNLSDVYSLTKSDPVICTDDDVLCPKLEPDWLSVILQAVEDYPDVWMLGTNNPGDNRTGSREPYEDDGRLVLCKYVSGHFLAIRRKVLKVTPRLFTNDVTTRSPNKTQAKWVHRNGGKTGYLRDVYTWHYCPESIRRPGYVWEDEIVVPVDMDTLEPEEKYKQCKL